MSDATLDQVQSSPEPPSSGAVAADARVVSSTVLVAKVSRLHRSSRLQPRPPRGPALVGKRLLYCWPGEGWQRGTVARLCTRGAF
jgi:hypothetical protein